MLLLTKGMFPIKDRMYLRTVHGSVLLCERKEMFL